MRDDAMQEMLEVLRDPLFANARKIADERPLSWSEFKRMPQPRGMKPRQSWELLCALRRQTAVVLPFVDGRGRTGWYSLTRSLSTDLDDIDRRCHVGSWLDLAIKSRNTTYFLVEAHVDEAITAIREDGLKLGYEKARQVLLGERNPESVEERLLLNEHRAIWDLDEYVERSCTPELIIDLYQRVTEGVGEQATPSAVHGSPLWERSRMDATSALRLVSKLVNANERGRDEHPLLLAMGVRYLFLSVLPLPAWNGVLASLVMKLLFKKSSLPVLAFVPVVKAAREWESGEVRPPVVAATLADSETLVNGEVDYTMYMSVVTHLVRLRLREVEEEIERVIKQDEDFSRMLQDSVDINHRQRMVLRMALSNPEATFKIKTHQQNHRIAYATARADLMKLADLGFLTCSDSNRAFDFRVVHGLRQVLAERTNGSTPLTSGRVLLSEPQMKEVLESSSS